MSNKLSNFPAAELSRIDGSKFVGKIVSNLRELAKDQRKPGSIQELKQRIDSYFEFCEMNNRRPGIEQLCLSLGITRQCLLNWCSGQGRGKDPEWAETCKLAKQFVIAFLEFVNLEGAINPVSAIFLLKAWAGYRETQELVFTKDDQIVEEMPTLEEIAKKLPKQSNYDSTSYEDSDFKELLDI